MTDLERYTVDGVGRVYFDEEGTYYLSVTTILGMKPEPDGLTYWKEKNDGEDGNPDWRDILSYKANRGTLLHYECLNEFVEGDMWSEDEATSKEAIATMADPWDEDTAAQIRYEQDRDWTLNQAWPMIKRKLGITIDDVVEVECFVRNDDVGYAGQFDLLYWDEDAEEYVLADIKTSKRTYDKHRTQLVCYKNAVDYDVGRCEILRMNPDYAEWEIVTSDEWPESEVELWDEFLELTSKIDYAKIEEIRDQADGTAETMHG